MKKILAAVLLLPTILLAQSPNLDIGTVTLLLNDYQLKSEKGGASGYAPLDSSSLVPGANLFPSFGAASDGTIWAKSGSTFSAVTGYTFTSTNMTINTIRIGLIGGSNYGITETNSSRPLVLQGGSTINRVYVANGQTLGGANGGYSAFTWSIGPSGSFSLGGGSFSDDVDVNGNDLTEVANISAASGLSINLTDSEITAPSNTNISVLATSGYGLIVPNTTVSTGLTLALNRGSANSIYGRLASDNTFSGSNAFGNVSIGGNLLLSVALPVGSGGSGATTASAARTNLGLEIGTNVQAFNQRLKDIADLGSPTNNSFLVGNGSTWAAISGGTARTALGLTAASVGDASGLTSGELPDARLSTNIPRKNGTNVFTGANTFGSIEGTSQIAVQINSTPVSLTSNGQSVSITSRTVLALSSNSTSAASREFTLSGGTQGQIVVISFEGSGSQTCRLLKQSGYNLTGNWEPVDGDSITLVYNTNSEWCEVARSVSARSLGVSLTSNSIEVDPGVFSVIKVTSDNATPANRIFTLSNGGTTEKAVQIVYTGTSTNTCRLADSGNAKLASDWEPQEGDAISLIWTGSGGYWAETSRSNN